MVLRDFEKTFDKSLLYGKLFDYRINQLLKPFNQYQPIHIIIQLLIKTYSQ